MSKLGDILRKIRRPRPAGPRPTLTVELDMGIEGYVRGMRRATGGESE